MVSNILFRTLVHIAKCTVHYELTKYINYMDEQTEQKCTVNKFKFEDKAKV